MKKVNCIFGDLTEQLGFRERYFWNRETKIFQNMKKTECACFSKPFLYPGQECLLLFVLMVIQHVIQTQIFNTIYKSTKLNTIHKYKIKYKGQNIESKTIFSLFSVKKYSALIIETSICIKCINGIQQKYLKSTELDLKIVL